MNRMSFGRKLISRLFILAGISLVLVALALEAYHYPWKTLFGTGDQLEVSIPDPSPIVLKDEDKDSVVITHEQEPSPDSLPQESASTNLLPGDEKAEAAPPPSYIQLGILKIPRLSVSEHVLEGTQRQLRYGVGHVESSAGIGKAGNCAIAGHNTTAFHYLNKLLSGDSVILKADGNVYTYLVYEDFTVLPTETWVLDSVENKTYTLTLITCTPYMVSSHRLIVRAQLIDINGMAPEDYVASASASPSG